MRVVIASRIFEPEPSAASFRLGALATAFAEAGHDVTVLTVYPATDRAGAVREDRKRKIRVKRFPVLRDRMGYVRGYVQYLSFDLPLFFRILFGRRCDLIVSEPPPTTGFFVRCASALRRTPYAYYAADIWSDASKSTGAPGLVVGAVRGMERCAMLGARGVLSVNDGVTSRVRQIAPQAHVHTVGNGIDTSVFAVDGPVAADGRYLIYSGTASEWQGAGIFIDALERLRVEYPDVRLVFLGQGSDWDALRERAALLPDGAVEFVPTVPPMEAAAWIRGAVASTASIRPDAGYSFAFPTKVFASWATGVPVVFAGPGPVREFMDTHATDAALGIGCDYDLDAVTDALGTMLAAPSDPMLRKGTGEWAARTVSLRSVARRAVEALTGGNP